MNESGMDVSKLIGHQLDYEVAKALGLRATIYQGYCFIDARDRPEVKTDTMGSWNPSTNWAQCGPIIEREGILFHGDMDGNRYNAWITDPYSKGGGPTHLIAAMRCYVASKLGDEVEIPKELL